MTDTNLSEVLECTCSSDRLQDHRTSIELALEASLPPSDTSSTSSSDDSMDSKTHGVDFETLAVSIYMTHYMNDCWKLYLALALHL